MTTLGLFFHSLFLSDCCREIADPGNVETLGNGRFIELFNLGCEDIDLSTGYFLRRFTNQLTVPNVWQDRMAMTKAHFCQRSSVLRLVYSPPSL